MRACVDAAPVIDGRRANCNLASLGVQRSKPSTPKHGTFFSFYCNFIWENINNSSKSYPSKFAT